MIYIVGYEFVPSVQRQASGSIQERINASKRVDVNYGQFKANKKYTLYYIKTVLKDNVKVLEYTFSSQDGNILMNFNSFDEADSYIAKISGNMQDLVEYRKNIEANQDF